MQRNKNKLANLRRIFGDFHKTFENHLQSPLGR